MKGTTNPRRGLSLALSRSHLVLLALLLAISFSVSGCKKNLDLGGKDNSGSSSNSTSQSGNNDNSKDPADRQGQATQPDKGNFTVQYADVQNPKYAEINDSYRKQRLLESIADELNNTIAIPES